MHANRQLLQNLTIELYANFCLRSIFKETVSLNFNNKPNKTLKCFKVLTLKILNLKSPFKLIRFLKISETIYQSKDFWS